MYRAAAPRSLALPRALLRPSCPAISARQLHKSVAHAVPKQPFAISSASSALAPHAKPLSLAVYRPMTALVRRHASSATPGTTANPDKEAKFAQRTIKPSPDTVSATSTVQPIFTARRQEDDDVEMMAGVRHDIKVIRETFALDEVPTQAYRLGLAGVLPYLATSSATVACAFEMNTAAHYGSGYILSADAATAILHAIEPIQIGYGAVILSFLGAIHWGMEWAGYGGYQGYRRYAIGVLAPAVAWPTILMPVEYALITQFLAFNTLYAVDADATVKGWTPPWYQTYRFILTFVVGASIVFSLIGRGMIQDQITYDYSPTAQRIQSARNLTGDASPKKDAAAEESDSESE